MASLGDSSPTAPVPPLTPAGDRVPPGGLELSFAGCGFLGIYHVGVSACLRQCATALPIGAIAGASAGAMAAACLLAGADLGAIRASIVQTAADARSSALGPMSPTFNIHAQLRQGLTQVLPPDAHRLVSGRLVVSLTRVCDGRSVLFTHFTSRQELIEVLLCSSFIPFFSGLRPGKVRGVRYIDGGVSNNCPLLGPATVTVSPFSGEADVCPADASASMMNFSVTNTNFQISRRNIQRFVHALFPPDPEALRRVCQQGFNDMLDFLQKNGLVSCPRCSKILSLASSSNLRNSAASEEEEEELTTTAACGSANSLEKSLVGHRDADRRHSEIIEPDSSSRTGFEGKTRCTSTCSATEYGGDVRFQVCESDFSGPGLVADNVENGRPSAAKEDDLGKNDASYVRCGIKPPNHPRASGRKAETTGNGDRKTEEENVDNRGVVCQSREADPSAPGDVAVDGHVDTAAPGWVGRLDPDTDHLCQDVRSLLGLQQPPSLLGVGLSESVCRMKCYNCPDCRSLLQEALMTGGTDAPLKVPRSLVAVTFASLSLLTLPLTRSLRLQRSLISLVLRALPLTAVLRLYHLTAAAAAVTASALARRRCVRDIDGGDAPLRAKEAPSRGQGRPGDRLPRRIKRTRSVGSVDLTPWEGAPLGVQGAGLVPYREGLEAGALQEGDAQQEGAGLDDLLQGSLLAYYFEEGHMTECWALTTLTRLCAEP